MADNTNHKYCRKLRYWTPDKVNEFISDKDKLTLDEWMNKWGYTDRKAIMKLYYTFSSK